MYSGSVRGGELWYRPIEAKWETRHTTCRYDDRPYAYVHSKSGSVQNDVTVQCPVANGMQTTLYDVVVAL